MSGSLANVHVLIVDDSKHICRLVATMLRSYGCKNLVEAKTAQQALDILNRQHIDIALVDWMLDERAHTGLDLIRQIRRSPHENLTYLPIIMMTGHTERDNIERARDAGMTEFLAKPFTAKNLHSRLVALIEQPRPFVKTRSFFGPDRRRRNEDIPPENDRRFKPAKREKNT